MWQENKPPQNHLGLSFPLFQQLPVWLKQTINPPQEWKYDEEWAKGQKSEKETGESQNVFPCSAVPY